MLKRCERVGVISGCWVSLLGVAFFWLVSRPMGRTFFNLTVGEVDKGSSLCRRNSRRLVSDAEALLEHGRSTGLAYALWSFAVEEYGKALKLEKLTAGKTKQEVVQVPKILFREHEKKFKEGFKSIQHRVGSSFAHAVEVVWITGSASRRIEHPDDPKWLVVAHGTGEYEDTSRGVPKRGGKALVGLRLDFLYVDWDDEKQVWRQPEQEIKVAGLRGTFTVSSNDVREAIGALRDELNRTP